MTETQVSTRLCTRISLMAVADIELVKEGFGLFSRTKSFVASCIGSLPFNYYIWFGLTYCFMAGVLLQ